MDEATARKCSRLLDEATARKVLVRRPVCSLTACPPAFGFRAGGENREAEETTAC